MEKRDPLRGGMPGISPVRPREALPFKAESEARLRRSLEQAPAFRPGGREVHSRCIPLSEMVRAKLKR